MAAAATIPGLPYVEELSGLDPHEAFRRFADWPHVVFLDSAMAGPLGRYSYVSADPLAWLESRRGSPGDPFEAVRRLTASARFAPAPGVPPFQGGVAGLFAYDLAHRLEDIPPAAIDDFEVPELGVGLYDWVLAFDAAERRAWLVVTGLPDLSLTRIELRREQVLRRLEAPPAALTIPSVRPASIASPRFPVPDRERLASNFDRAGYLRMLRQGIDYIHAGDCFQVNLAQRLIAPQSAPAVEIYNRLRQRNAAPFAGYLDLGDYAIASASPERFLKLTAGDVETRPIKGTRPRGVYPMEDMARGGDLLESLKDRAENVMIVDLLRNDLGRVCRYGSIHVSAVCQLETFRFVHHLVSEVRGSLRNGLDAVDLIRATFPGGSVTGAPKVRAMQIISELEGVARGAYCGCLGYLGFDGSMDLNLLIRTLVLGRGWAHFSVGGGIVADSVPEREYEETWHKAAGILDAIE